MHVLHQENILGHTDACVCLTPEEYFLILNVMDEWAKTFGCQMCMSCLVVLNSKKYNGLFFVYL